MRKSLVDPETGLANVQQATDLQHELATLLMERGGVFSLEYVGKTGSWTAIWRNKSVAACHVGRTPVEAIDRLLTEVVS